MTTGIAYTWAPITKMEKQDDGTLIVHGPAATSSVDRVKQRCDPTWLSEAMPAWLAEGGNVREMHDAKRAVGVAVGYAADGDQHNIAARIVDPVAIAKCETGVLKGFSVGISRPHITFTDPSAPGGVICGGDIIEVSVVDRPANPDCLLALAKVDGAGVLTDVETPTVVEGVAAQLAAIVSQFGAIAKADETPDITGAQQAIAAIAKLIVREAQSLARGELTEAADIQTLLDAVNALQWFIYSERNEQMEAASKVDGITKSLGADEPAVSESLQTVEGGSVDETTATKAEVTASEAAAPKVDDVPDTTKTEQPTLTKAEVADIVKAAIDTATAPLRAEIDTLKALPAPGGPVLTRTHDALAAANTADASLLKVQANELLTKAQQHGDDPALAEGYRIRAQRLLERSAR